MDLSVTFHHRDNYSVTLRTGNDVSDADRTTAERVPASIRPWHPTLPQPAYGRCVSGWELEQPGVVGSLGSALHGIDLASPGDGWAVGAYTHRAVRSGGASGTNIPLKSGALRAELLLVVDLFREALESSVEIADLPRFPFRKEVPLLV